MSRVSQRPTVAPTEMAGSPALLRYGYRCSESVKATSSENPRHQKALAHRKDGPLQAWMVRDPSVELIDGNSTRLIIDGIGDPTISCSQNIVCQDQSTASHQWQTRIQIPGILRLDGIEKEQIAAALAQLLDQLGKQRQPLSLSKMSVVIVVRPIAPSRWKVVTR